MEEDSVKISLEERYKEALRKAKEVREWVARTNDGSEPSTAECLAYDMKYVEEYVENLLKAYKENEAVIEEMANSIYILPDSNFKSAEDVIKRFRNKVKENKE